MHKAVQREIVYDQLINNGKILFDRGSTIMVHILEDHNSVIDDFARMRHRSNEFFKTKDEFNEMLKSHQLEIGKLKTKQIE